MMMDFSLGVGFDVAAISSAACVFYGIVYSCY